jgi:signal transduction histidine kinase
VVADPSYVLPLQRCLPRSPTTRVVLAGVLVLGLIAGMAALENARSQRAENSDRAALAARVDAINIESALTLYWGERETMNEYLLRHRAPILAQVLSKNRALDKTLGIVAVKSRQEGALVFSVLGANDALVDIFTRYTDAATHPTAVARVLRDMDRQAGLVLGPLRGLRSLHETETRIEERRASASNTQARNLNAAVLLIVSVAIMLSSVWAIRLFRRIADQNRELKVLDTLKDEFVASVSHELRTPLTSIVGYVDLVLDENTGPLNDDQRRFLGTVNRSSQRLLRLVGDLLFIAHLDATSLSLDRTALSLTSLVEDAVDAALPAAGLKDLTLTMNASNDLNLVGDAARLTQLLDNLISNAIKFTAEGTVTVTLREHSGSAMIEVTDSGPGIPAGEQKRLFERFYRTSAANVNAVQGSGLGLSIAKAIAEAHHGTIECESVEGEGTTLRVLLPLERFDRESLGGVSPAPSMA